MGERNGGIGKKWEAIMKGHQISFERQIIFRFGLTLMKSKFVGKR